MAADKRRPRDSYVETTHLLLPPDTNSHGTAFGGRIMQWMDIAAGIAAQRHCGEPCVTASVDQINFSQAIRVGDVVVMKASVNYTGRTSMEVGVRVESEHPRTRQRKRCLTGYFTFVAIDSHGTPMPVPEIHPESDDEKRRYARAKERRAQRLANKED